MTEGLREELRRYSAECESEAAKLIREGVAPWSAAEIAARRVRERRSVLGGRGEVISSDGLSRAGRANASGLAR